MMLEIFGTVILGCIAAVAVVTTVVFVIAAGKGIYSIYKKQ